MFGLFRKAPVSPRSTVHPSTVGTPDLSQRLFTRALLRSATVALERIQKDADRVGMTVDATLPASADLDDKIAASIRLMTGKSSGWYWNGLAVFMISFRCLLLTLFRRMHHHPWHWLSWSPCRYIAK